MDLCTVQPLYTCHIGIGESHPGPDPYQAEGVGAGRRASHKDHAVLEIPASAQVTEIKSIFERFAPIVPRPHPRLNRDQAQPAAWGSARLSIAAWGSARLSIAAWGSGIYKRTSEHGIPAGVDGICMGSSWCGWDPAGVDGIQLVWMVSRRLGMVSGWCA